MEIAPYAAGWLSILPPIIAIGLALVTKEVLSSLLLGVLSGSLIWAIGTGANPVMGTVSATFGIMVNKLDFTIILFTSMLGALVYCISLSGATKAYGHWALGKIRSRRGALMATTGLGICIFIDDYFSCLTTGTVMRPVTDAHRISRAKLAYLVDTTAAPVCIIAPISSWALSAPLLRPRALLKMISPRLLPPFRGTSTRCSRSVLPSLSAGQATTSVR